MENKIVVKVGGREYDVRRFVPVVGAHLSEKQAEVYGRHITVVMGDVESCLPEDVVRDAKKKSSPLHSYFEWNDAVAASRWRIAQAKTMLRGINVEIIKDGVPVHLRAFPNAKILKVDGQGEAVSRDIRGKDRVCRYIPIARAMTDEELRQQLLADAMRRLELWQKQYRQYGDDELAAVFQAIEETKKKLAIGK